MFVIGNFLISLAKVLDMLVPFLYWMIIIRAVISWFSPDPYNTLVQLLYRFTEPMLAPFRKLIPAYSLGIDLSPIFAILTLVFLRYFLVSSLYELGAMLK